MKGELCQCWRRFLFEHVVSVTVIMLGLWHSAGLKQIPGIGSSVFVLSQFGTITSHSHSHPRTDVFQADPHKQILTESMLNDSHMGWFARSYWRNQVGDERAQQEGLETVWISAVLSLQAAQSVCVESLYFFSSSGREREKKLATSGLQMSFFFYCREPAGLYWGLTGNRNMQVICQDSPRTLSHTHFVPRPAIKLFIHSLYSLHRLYILRSFLVCVVGNERFCN